MEHVTLQVSDEWHAQLQPGADHAECCRQEVQSRHKRHEGETYLFRWGPRKEMKMSSCASLSFVCVVLLFGLLNSKTDSSLCTLSFDLPILQINLTLFELEDEEWAFSWVSGAPLARDSIPAWICLWMFSLLLFLLYLSSSLKVSPSKAACLLHPSCVMCTTSCPSYLLSISSPAVILPFLFHASIASLVTCHLYAYYALSNHSSIASHTLWSPHHSSQWRRRSV